MASQRDKALVNFHPTFNCRQCKIAFGTKRDQLLHRKDCHENNPNERKYTCKECNKKFANLGNLDRHSATHSNVKPFQCTQCEKLFTQAANLSRHLSTVHNGDRPFQCEVCNKTFTQQGNLRRHQLIHTGEKPFRCKRCNRSFSQRTNLKKHVMAHQGFRPHKCSICQKSFIQLQNYKTHLKTHGIQEEDGECGGSNLVVVPKDVNVEDLEDLKGNDVILKCSVCRTVYNNVQDFQSHTIFCDVIGNGEVQEFEVYDDNQSVYLDS